jgi:hypothetical protein
LIKKRFELVFAVVCGSIARGFLCDVARNNPQSVQTIFNDMAVAGDLKGSLSAVAIGSMPLESVSREMVVMPQLKHRSEAEGLWEERFEIL